MIVSCASFILQLYAAMAIGPNLLKNRLGGSILAYIIIAVASQFIYFGIMVGIVSSIASMGGLTTDLSEFSTSAAAPIFDTVIGSLAIYYIIVAVVCWILTRYMLKRKLNLA